MIFIRIETTGSYYTAKKKMKFSIKDFFSECEQIRSVLNWKLHFFLRTFADYTNLFCSDDDVNTPFTTVNKETQKINKKLISYKLHLNLKNLLHGYFSYIHANIALGSGYITNLKKINN